MGYSKNIFIGDFSIKIPETFISFFWSRARRGARRGGRGRALTTVRTRGCLSGRHFYLFRYGHETGALINRNSGSEQDFARPPLAWVNDCVFGGRFLPTFKHGNNVAIPAGSSPRVDAENDDIIKIRNSQRRESHPLRHNIGSILKLTSASSFPPLYSVEKYNRKGQNAQNNLGAVVQPSSKTILGYAFILLGLVISYFGFCALYKGWYRRAHGLSRGTLGLCIGLVFIAASAFILGHGFYLITM
jgi:hypothetical protein